MKALILILAVLSTTLCAEKKFSEYTKVDCEKAIADMNKSYSKAKIDALPCGESLGLLTLIERSMRIVFEAVCSHTGIDFMTSISTIDSNV